MTNKLKKTMIICIALVAFIMLLVCVHLYTNKSCTVDGSLNEEKFSLIEGEYEIGFNYSSSHDFALAAFYEANGQRLPLFATILPATEGEGHYLYNLKLPISIRNNTIFFETLEDDINITSVNIKSRHLPFVPIFVFIAFLAQVVVLLKVYNKADFIIYTAILNLLLEPILIVNPWMILIWLAVVVSFVCLIKKEKLKIGRNIQIFALFFIISIAFMEFFTTTSPLFASNTAFDPNVYYSVGAALAHGRDLYSEVFDQKGPVTFVIFLIGYLISPGYFYGVWLIEALSASIGMYFAYKISAFFAKDKMSLMIGGGTLVIYLNESYLVSGATAEEFVVTLILAMLYLVFPYIYNKAGKITQDDLQKIFRTFLLLGILSAMAFYIKFNLSGVIIVGAFILWLAVLKYHPVKSAFGYVCGFAIVTVPILIYFVLTKAVTTFYHCYFAFNLGYGGISSTSEVVSRMISNVYEAFLSNKLTAFLIVFGIAVLVFKNIYLNIWGRVLILLSFLALLVGQYVSVWIFPYHFMPLAAFAVLGLIVAGWLIEKYVLRRCEDEINSVNISTYAITIALMLTVAFLNNTNINSSFIRDKDPLKQEVIAQQMDYYSMGSDYTFFDLGFLESGVYQAAKKYPNVQYFYMPNIDAEINIEPLMSQYSYIENMATDYIVWRGFNDENTPNLEPIDRNYDRVATYISKDDEYYMIYQKKNF